MNSKHIKALIESLCSNRTFDLNQTNSKCGGADKYMLFVHSVLAANSVN